MKCWPVIHATTAYREPGKTTCCPVRLSTSLAARLWCHLHPLTHLHPLIFEVSLFWTRSINMMQKIGSCVGCLQVKVSHGRASSPWAARQSVSWIHVCVHLYVGVVRIGLMKIMRDAIMRMQKQRRHVYAVYCCIGAWAASGDQVFILRHIGAGAIWVDASDASHRMYKGKAR
jgi:hypothetical protein